MASSDLDERRRAAAEKQAARRAERARLKAARDAGLRRRHETKLNRLEGASNMAAGDTTITIVGNLVEDPNLRFTPSGQAVANFRVASTPRYMDRQTNEWKDGDSLFLGVTVWKQQAENVAESLQRGMRVIVTGRLKQRSYETKQGEKRTVYEVEADEVGPSLRNATAKVVKTTRQNGQQGQRQQRNSGPADPWDNQPAATGAGYSDSPPF